MANLSGAWIDRVHARWPQLVIVLDMDTSVSETHGRQEGSAYNGHFGCICYHPLFVFHQFGDLERCALLARGIARYRGQIKRWYFRADAAVANPEICELLEAEGYKCTIRLPANAVLQASIAWLLTDRPRSLRVSRNVVARGPG